MEAEENRSGDVSGRAPFLVGHLVRVGPLPHLLSLSGPSVVDRPSGSGDPPFVHGSRTWDGVVAGGQSQEDSKKKGGGAEFPSIRPLRGRKAMMSLTEDEKTSTPTCRACWRDGRWRRHCKQVSMTLGSPRWPCWPPLRSTGSP